MEITTEKILALVIVLASVALTIMGVLPLSIGKALVFMLIGLVLIWFPDLGDVRGWVRGGNIDTDSPPFLVSFLGWIFLLGMPFVLYWVS